MQEFNAAIAGLTQLPLVVCLIALSRWAGGLVDRYGARWPLTIGAATAALGFLLLSFPGLTRGPGDFWKTYLPALLVLGTGLALTAAPLSATVMGAVPSSQSGLASGINSTLSRLSGVLAIAILGPIALSCFARSLDSRAAALDLVPQARAALAREAVKLGDAEPPSSLTPTASVAVANAVKLSFVDAFRRICHIAAGLSLAGALVAVYTLPDRGNNASSSSSSSSSNSPESSTRTTTTRTIATNSSERSSS